MITGIAGLSAISSRACGDRTKAEPLRIKADGDVFEGENYGLAADLARQNARFIKVSTAIKQTQLERDQAMSIGGPTRWWPVRAWPSPVLR
jgi:hypothetical protein